jgi:uncharacterized membrane protein
MFKILRNGTTNMFTWLVSLIAIYKFIFSNGEIPVVLLLQVFIFSFLCVCIFLFAFKKNFTKDIGFTGRLTLFMFLILLWESCWFPLVGWFIKGKLVQWLILILVVIVLYTISIMIYSILSKKQEKIMSRKLLEYQAERTLEHG